MIKNKNFFVIVVLMYIAILNVFANPSKFERDEVIDPFRKTSSARIGDYPFPTNPMNDRAIGYLLKENKQWYIQLW